MKRQFLLLIIVCIFLACTASIPTYAYTEEEKQQVKEWLAANGYPATMEGAEQAYQDYLNGKFGPVGGDKNPGGEAPKTDNQPEAPVPAPAENIEDTEDITAATIKPTATPDVKVQSAEKKETAAPKSTTAANKKPTEVPVKSNSGKVVPQQKNSVKPEMEAVEEKEVLSEKQEFRERENAEETAAALSAQSPEHAVSTLGIAAVILLILLLAGGIILWKRKK